MKSFVANLLNDRRNEIVVDVVVGRDSGAVCRRRSQILQPDRQQRNVAFIQHEHASAKKKEFGVRRPIAIEIDKDRFEGAHHSRKLIEPCDASGSTTTSVLPTLVQVKCFCFLFWLVGWLRIALRNNNNNKKKNNNNNNIGTAQEAGEEGG